MNRRIFALSTLSILLLLALSACDFKLKSVQLDTGVTLSYAQQGSRHGPTVIFLHGYTDSWFSFSRVLPLLPQNIRAYAISQRGHGDSDKPASGYDQAQFAADVEAFMDRKHIDDAIIVGHSMGSLIAHKFAVTYPERVEKLVLVGSTPTMSGNEGFQGFLDYINSEPAVVNDEAFVRDFQESTLYTGEGANPVPDSFLDQVIAESMKVEFQTWQGALQGLLDEDHVAELANIECPTLIMWGEQDAIFTNDEQQALLAAIPTATLTTYPDTGHAPHWERPEAFTADLLAFIAE